MHRYFNDILKQVDENYVESKTRVKRESYVEKDSEEIEIELVEDLELEFPEEVGKEQVQNLFDGYLGEQREVPNPLEYGPNATYRNLREGVVYKKGPDNLWETFVKDGIPGKQGAAGGSGTGVNEVKQIIVNETGITKDSNGNSLLSSTVGPLDISQIALSPWAGYSAMKHVSVKLDGSGDFTDIQNAINSITDASPGNQYVVDVYDDFSITSVSSLCYQNNLSVKLGNLTTLTNNAALFFTKDWVHVRGVGSQRKIKLVMPTNLTNTSYQWIQPVFVAGNCILSNFYFSIQGGRYAIHQDNGRNPLSLDINATTIYENITAEHFGNATALGYPAGAWSSICAQANGTASGQKQIFKGCQWLSSHAQPFYFHSNSNFSEPTEHYFENCKIVRKIFGNMTTYNPNYVDMGSGQSCKIIIRGCDFKKFTVNGGIYSDEKTYGLSNFAANGSGVLLGDSNTKSNLSENHFDCMRFSANISGSAINITGGSAYYDIYGGDYINYSPGNNLGGRTFGKIRIVDPNLALGNSQIFSLPYRLGNCSASPKTLTLTVGITPYTITFNKNYMTSAGTQYNYNTTPAISTASILSDINAVASSAFSVSLHSPINLQTYQDCGELGYNATSSVFSLGNALKRDTSGMGCWKLCGVGDFAEGFACDRFGPGETGFVAYATSVYVQNWLIGIYSDVPVGSLYKCAANGTFVTTTDTSAASIVAFDPDYFTGYVN